MREAPAEAICDPGRRLWRELAAATTISTVVGALSTGTTAAAAGEWKCAAQIAHELSAMPLALFSENCRWAEFQ